MIFSIFSILLRDSIFARYSQSAGCPDLARGSKNGTTLAEIMVAMVILVTPVLLIFGIFSAGSVRMRQARALSTASFLAKQKLEEVMVESEIFEEEGVFQEPFPEYEYKVTVKEYEEDPSLEQIEVTVKTPQGAGGKRVNLVMLRRI